MHATGKRVPKLREGDKVRVRRVDAWVTGEVVCCANGFVCVRWGSQARWSYRARPGKALPWTSAVPCDAEFVRRDLTGVPLTPTQRRAIAKREAKSGIEQELEEEARRQQMMFARKGSKSEAVGDGDGSDGGDEHMQSVRRQHLTYSQYIRSVFNSLTRDTEEPKTVSAPPSQNSKRDGQYAYALYKGKRYTSAELDAVLKVDRKKAALAKAQHKRTDREELLHYLSQNVEDPDEPDYFCEEVYSMADFSEAGDDRGWGEEDDVAVSWDDGDGRRPALGRAADRRPPRQQRRERRGGRDGEQPQPWGAEQSPAWAESNNVILLDNQSASNPREDEDEDQQPQSTTSSAAAAVNGDDWDNPYDLPSFGDEASCASLSSVLDAQPFPTSSLSLESFSSMNGPVSYGMPSAGEHASNRTGSSNYNLVFEETPTSSSSASDRFRFDDASAASSASDRFRFDDDDGGMDHGHSGGHEAWRDNAVHHVDDHWHADGRADSNSDDHHETGTSGAAAEDGGGGFGELFNEEAASVRHELDDRRERTAGPQRPPTTGATKTASAGKTKGGERVSSTATAGRPQDRNSNVVVVLADVHRQQKQEQREKQQQDKDAKRREKWDARQVKREQFKRRQREERRLAAKTDTDT